MQKYTSLAASLVLLGACATRRYNEFDSLAMSSAVAQQAPASQLLSASPVTINFGPGNTNIILDDLACDAPSSGACRRQLEGKVEALYPEISGPVVSSVPGHEVCRILVINTATRQDVMDRVDAVGFRFGGTEVSVPPGRLKFVRRAVLADGTSVLVHRFLAKVGCQAEFTDQPADHEPVFKVFADLNCGDDAACKPQRAWDNSAGKGYMVGSPLSDPERLLPAAIDRSSVLGLAPQAN